VRHRAPRDHHNPTQEGQVDDGNDVTPAAMAMALIPPLGGELVGRQAKGAELEQLIARARHLPTLTLNESSAADLQLIGAGAYSPLRGFLTRRDYDAVVEHAQLADGTPWTLPITLAAGEELTRTLRAGAEVALCDDAGTLQGTISVEDVFNRDAQREAAEVYRTTDASHPGVRALLEQPRRLIGGAVLVVPQPTADLSLSPAQTRSAFAARDWSTVVAFQTRNPVHRAHEYLTKIALEQVDGLLLHPLVGMTKDDDVPAEVRMECYRVLLDAYYPAARVLLSTFEAGMRYAGPREAIFHGLVRRNYGCSHFIIGRDAAGVGTYYGTYDAQRLYDELGGAARLGFTAFKFEHTFYCRACESMASDRTCPHDLDARLVLSGTRVRELLREGVELPHEFTRPEVAAVLRSAYGAVVAGAVG
jgi:sulfate adenylyltransferase